MNWIRINDSLIQASGRGFTYSVRELPGRYLVKKDSCTNGSNRETVGTMAEAIALAESWEGERA